jgi:peptide/nickel transport system ATP-binding protein
MESAPVISLRRLSVEYAVGGSMVRAVDEVSLDIRRGEILGLVGESGSGKTTLGSALLGLIEKPHRIQGGTIEFAGVGNVAQMTAGQLRHYRWEKIAVVFQSAQNALNPLMTVGDQARVIMQSHRPIADGDVDRRLADLLTWLGLDVERVMTAYPHQLSGGMKQRVGIAMALLLEPEVLVLDEPTTALDVMNQAEVIESLKGIHETLGTTMLFITHDMSVVAELTDRVAVMYAGRLVETGPVDGIFYHPQHPYTQALMGAAPSLKGDPLSLKAIPGQPPDLRRPPPGCRFAPRCPHAVDECRAIVPPLVEVQPGHQSACILTPALPSAEDIS